MPNKVLFSRVSEVFQNLQLDHPNIILLSVLQKISKLIFIWKLKNMPKRCMQRHCGMNCTFKIFLNKWILTHFINTYSNRSKTKATGPTMNHIHFKMTPKTWSNCSTEVKHIICNKWSLCKLDTYWHLQKCWHIKTSA